MKNIEIAVLSDPLKYILLLFNDENNITEYDMNKNSISLVILLEKLMYSFLSKNIKDINGLYFKKKDSGFIFEVDVLSLGKSGKRYNVSDLSKDNPNKVFKSNPTDLRKLIDYGVFVNIQELLNKKMNKIDFGGKLTANPFGVYLIDVTYKKDNKYIFAERLRGVMGSNKIDELLRLCENSFDADMERLLLQKDRKIEIKNNAVVIKL